MAVYVDDLMQAYTGGGWKWSHSCHMMADDVEELHRFASRIGLKRSWFHRDHYDLNASKRALAVKNGAVEVSSRCTMVELRRRFRQEGDRWDGI